MADTPSDPRRYLPGGPPQHRGNAITARFRDAADAERALAELRQAGYQAERDRVRLGLAGAGLDLSEGLTGGIAPPAAIMVAVAVAVEGGRWEPAIRILRRHGGEV